jgi:hypothetical protein
MKQLIDFAENAWHFSNDENTVRVDVDKELYPDGEYYFRVTKMHNDAGGTIIQTELQLSEDAAKNLVELWTK